MEVAYKGVVREPPPEGEHEETYAVYLANPEEPLSEHGDTEETGEAADVEADRLLERI